MAQALKFAPLSGSCDVSFFSELERRKLHEYRLSDAPVDVLGSYARAERRTVESPLCLSADSFAADATSIPPSLCVVPGSLRNANTLEDFKEWDKAAMLQEGARRIADDIVSGAAVREPERLLRFLLLTFADLKTHKFWYWFAFPALAISPPPTQTAAPLALAEAMSAAQITQLVSGYAALGSRVDVTDGAPAPAARAPPFFAVRVPADGAAVEVGPLTSFVSWRQQAAAEGGNAEALLGFCDPCPRPAHPGWPLRNLLALAATLLDGGKGGSVRVICFREPPLGTSATIATAGTVDAALPPTSLVLSVNVPPPPEGLVAQGAPLPAAVGWEKNANGNLGPRLMDLSAQMDPYALAEASVDLNLRLMKWRQMPSLEIERVGATRCLLMGAGTLGCAVARCLIGWGVRHITFVDSGVVSYSNPVRQTLFTFEDCLDGGKPKAQAAADRLKQVFTAVDVSAHRLAIPMPGHAVTANETPNIRDDCEKLSELVKAHDVVFLLTDTRESRWLPTLLAAHHEKLAINAALGFDSLMVMRHGACKPCASPPAANPPAAPKADGTHLGCYFCNDVVAPANSMLRRTLDQQCTVSRPGLSMIAAALAVELMVNVLHHPDGAAAAADIGGGVPAGGGGAARSPLGGVPHQLRWSLPAFRDDAMVGVRFDRCTACSQTVLAEYATSGFDFLLQAFNRATYLEDLTGLTQMHKETEAALENCDLFDEEDDDLDD